MLIHRRSPSLVPQVVHLSVLRYYTMWTTSIAECRELIRNVQEIDSIILSLHQVFFHSLKFASTLFSLSGTVHDPLSGPRVLTSLTGVSGNDTQKTSYSNNGTQVADVWTVVCMQVSLWYSLVFSCHFTSQKDCLSCHLNDSFCSIVCIPLWAWSALPPANKQALGQPCILAAKKNISTVSNDISNLYQCVCPTLFPLFF